MSSIWGGAWLLGSAQTLVGVMGVNNQHFICRTVLEPHLQFHCYWSHSPQGKPRAGPGQAQFNGKGSSTNKKTVFLAAAAWKTAGTCS